MALPSDISLSVSMAVFYGRLDSAWLESRAYRGVIPPALAMVNRTEALQSHYGVTSMRLCQTSQNDPAASWKPTGCLMLRPTLDARHRALPDGQSELVYGRRASCGDGDVSQPARPFPAHSLHLEFWRGFQHPVKPAHRVNLIVGLISHPAEYCALLDKRIRPLPVNQPDLALLD